MLPTYTRRTSLQQGEKVLGRYSVLPFYDELNDDVKAMGCTMINPPWAHGYVAGFAYYDDIKHLTFPSWTAEQFPLLKYEGPFVVKGATNSRKHDWKRSMFAPTRADAIRISGELKRDGLLYNQDIIFRKWEQLKILEEGIGCPFAAEWRFFFFGTKELASAYYWSEAQNTDIPVPDGAREIAHEAAKILSEAITFFVVDVAEKEDGTFIVVEVNDGQMSGLSCIDPKVLYKSLQSCRE